MTLEPMAYLAGGLLGSAHCVGMCGGFALAIGAARPRFGPALTNQLIYGIGRLVTYTMLGGLACGIGAAIGEWTGAMAATQMAISVLSGVLMLAVGISVLFGLGLPSFGISRKWSGRFSGLTTPVMRTFVQGPSRWRFFLAGVFTGFLPCGLLYAFLAIAMTQSHVFDGMLTMAFFGIGTIPAMTALGCGGAIVGHVGRRRIHFVASLFVVVLGVATIARGLPFVPCHWLAFGDHAGPTTCACPSMP